MNDLRDTERRLSNLLHETTPEPPASIDLHALARTAKTPSRRTSRDVVRRWAAPLIAAAAVVAAIAGGLSIVVDRDGDVPVSVDGVSPAQMDQARKALANWEEAVRANPSVAVLPTTQQVGQWEPAVAEEYAKALARGAFKVSHPLGRSAQPVGEIAWAGGDVRATTVLSAAATYEQLVQCAICEAPIVVTDAMRTTMTVQTPRGPATVPAWRFTLQNTKVELLRTAFPLRNLTPLPATPYNPNRWTTVSEANVSADGRTVTARFTGNLEECYSYTAHAVESGQALILVVNDHLNPGVEGCNDVGVPRTATLELPTSLAGRAILDLSSGLPIPIAPGG